VYLIDNPSEGVTETGCGLLRQRRRGDGRGVLFIVWLVRETSIVELAEGGLRGGLLDLFAVREIRILRALFRVGGGICGTVNERLQLDQILISVIELKMRAEGVQECDEQLMSIVLFIVCQVPRRAPNSPKDLSRHSSGNFCAIRPPKEKRGE
jgi:hypothetical protein